MKRPSQLSWRLGWLLLGFVGLIALSLLPSRRPQENVPIPAATSPQQWLDALWQPSPERVQSLLAAGASVDQVLDDMGNRPLHLLLIGSACRDPASFRPGLRALSLLMAAGAGVDVVDHRGNTPLMLAASRCEAAMVSALLESGADYSKTNERGLTAFEHTLSNPRGAADVLLEAGYRLTGDKAAHYLEVYADEPDVVALIRQAAAP